MTRHCTNREVGRTLAAYELGLTTAEESARFEAHVLNCNYCLARLERHGGTAAMLRDHPDLQQAVATALESGPAISTRRSVSDMLWPSDIAWPLRPGLLLGALAATIAIVIVGWLTLAAPDRVSVLQPIELSPHRNAATAAYPQMRDGDALLSFVYPGAIPGEPYVIVLRRDTSLVFQLDPYRDFDAFGIGRLYVPGEKLAPGNYSLTVRDAGTAGDSETVSYYFEITQP
ncbi:hypothetical protein GF420_12455 [candidate division GN15 bacterium]|nr:hypothetical protein [candidate division GN15 bacterium]